jgi:hypothetical protein
MNLRCSRFARRATIVILAAFAAAPAIALRKDPWLTFTSSRQGRPLPHPLR